MTYTLSNLLQDGIKTSGRVGYRTLFTTGGSTTTLIDTKLNLSTQPDYNDDDDTLVRGTVLVIRTTDGAAPQGEFQRISGYNESTATITVEAFSAAIGAGDTCMIIHSQFKLEEMVELANQALLDIGDIALVDTSITTAASQREYTLPVALKDARPLRVQLQGITTDANDNRWEDVTDYYITPASPGSTGLITFNKQFPSGRSIKIWYLGHHPALSAFDDDISDTAHPNLVRFALASEMWRWRNPSDGVELNQANEIYRKYAEAKVKHPIWKPKRSPKYFVSGRREEENFTTPDPA
jgi:hypothetical protein